MTAPLTLPRLSWGDPSSARRALLVHGLGSNGALMWRYGVALADAGWNAVAVDLRGHGVGPRALDYSIAAYAADVAATAPGDGGAWDLVVGHSLGGAAAVVAAAEHPSWAHRLVLVDPAIRPTPRDLEIVRASQLETFADPSESAVRAAHPGWHEHDIEMKATAAHQVSRWAVEQTSAQNQPWDVTAAAGALDVPTHVLGSDPAVYSIYWGERLDALRAANPRIDYSFVAGTGHSPHRDRPEATIAEFLRILEA
ncbi:alpha/beta fold hydrolase [Microbacterium rhizomatis]|uniref:Alpha/beta hydrolase n=1 Tax=Microbacterium rhizomatis TaxID=1631477 RepID=A0A5J5IXJ1_9MICO|nr:alpha/beta hydrolase [Microbacterium rhizomatis]KAA9105588.1 alpha/beta hydrolase [Microbacterium rhizomatis]